MTSDPADGSTDPKASAGSATERKPRPPVLAYLLILVIALPLGYVLLTIIQELVHLIWVEGANELSGPPKWLLVLGLPMAAGVAVALLRIHGREGHNPLDGLATTPVWFKHYPSLLGAIVVGLLGGIVLGPEVALVTTGSLVGCEVGRWRKVPDPHQSMMVGILAAVLALFVGPLAEGSYSVAPTFTFKPQYLIGAALVGVGVGVVLLVGRLLALGFIALRGGDRPAIVPMALIGLAVGAIALAYSEYTGHEVGLVLTSGEGMVKPLLALGTVTAVGLAALAKWFAYSLSLGGGFRGGPYFPALFIGAAVGEIAQLTWPTFAAGASAAGVVAAFAFIMHGSWKATIILGVVIGLLVGTWQVIAITVIGALFARLIPEITLPKRFAPPPDDPVAPQTAAAAA
ncbi:MAG: hypothetical protein RLZ55_281 [Actinomycetota bacterium]